MNGRKDSLDDGSRYTDFDDEERLQLEKDIELLQKRICEFEVYLMQMDATLGGIRQFPFTRKIGLSRETSKILVRLVFNLL